MTHLIKKILEVSQTQKPSMCSLSYMIFLMSHVNYLNNIYMDSDIIRHVMCWKR